MNVRAKWDFVAAIGFAVMFLFAVSATRMAAGLAVEDAEHVPAVARDVLLVAMAYFAPAACFFGLAAWAQSHRWRMREVAHVVAWGWAVCPLIAFAGLLTLALILG